MSQYDVGIIGGGLAGLASACLLSKKGFLVVLFEKNFYPFHRVCGEYISNESRGFLTRLGINLTELGACDITQFKLSHFLGSELNVALPQGGFGISRYTLDDKLADIALANGAILLPGTKVENVAFNTDKDNFTLQVNSGEFTCKTVIGAYGKKSKIDKVLNRPFAKAKKLAENNFVGIKYHLKSDVPAAQIELHLFENGYAGISQIEDGKSCFCYLTTANQMQKVNGSIERLENEVLAKNEHLKHYLNSSTKLFSPALSISQIEFGPKEQVFDHILMAGDSAGMITPLTGNGMSMALHAASLLAENLAFFLGKKIDRNTLEKNYERQWQKQFGKRVKLARRYQNLFFNARSANKSISVLNHFPFVVKMLINTTHGKPF